MPGLKFEVQLTICIVVSVLISMPGCLTAGTTDSATCADITNETDCCTSPLNCTYVANCTSDASGVTTVCVQDDDAAINSTCPKDQGTKTCAKDQPTTTAVPTTTTTIAPNATCAEITNVTNCCTSPLNCTYVANCTSNEGVATTVCVKDDDAAIKIACPKDQGTKTCAKDQPTTTAVPTTTTIAPKVKCFALNVSFCCGDVGQALSCDFVNCTGTPTCMNVTERAKCNATVADSMCHMQSSTTTVATTTTTTASGRGSDCNKQHFDGASFIGGIILCGGIIAIIFFGLKFYRSRQDSNYHTL